MRHRFTPALLGAVILLAGCTGPTATPQVVTVTASAPASPTPDPTADGWANAQAFAEAALKGKRDEAKLYVSPGSAADRYLVHQEAMDEAMIAAGDGHTESPDDITYDATSGTVTYTYTDADLTTEWNNFEYDANGKVISWSTGGSKVKLSDRLWTKPAKVSTSHATVQLVSAYKNDSALFVVLDITAKDRSISPDCSALLDDAKHRQREAADCEAPDKIIKGNSGYVALSFEKADFGGTLRYLVEDTSYNEFGTVKIPIR